MERIAVRSGESGERFQLHEGIVEMVSVRVQNRRDELAADLVEEYEIGVHGSPVAGEVVTVGDAE